MKVSTDKFTTARDYKVGLDRFKENVISSHFMQRLSQDPSLQLYERHRLDAELIVIDRALLFEALIPALIAQSEEFCLERANAARDRALGRRHEYGHSTKETIGSSEYITETILDKEFSRNGTRYKDRVQLNLQIKQTIERRLPIEMVIPALPFKIPSPLKARGPLPDLGEVNFLLSLYEIAKTVELGYRAEVSNQPGPLAKFTVVADGLRFNEAINKCRSEITTYQAELNSWTKTLGIDEYIRIVDYRSLLQDGLPEEIRSSKREIFLRAKTEYAKALWPIFDPDDMDVTLRAATEVELDPEHGNPEGRYVSLLKSLVFTMNYKSLQDLPGITDEERASLYRELTTHLFYPYITEPEARKHNSLGLSGLRAETATGNRGKEQLRRLMLNEVWNAAIDYIAEIKSDRDLDEDPIMTCLPGYLRWTIHAKHGQIAIATPPILGITAQAWAGSAVFRQTSKGRMRLCSLPVLLIEAMGAIPITVRSDSDRDQMLQPLFYIDRALGVRSIEDFLTVLSKSFTRRRFS